MHGPLTVRELAYFVALFIAVASLCKQTFSYLKTSFFSGIIIALAEDMWITQLEAYWFSKTAGRIIIQEHDTTQNTNV